MKRYLTKLMKVVEERRKELVRKRKDKKRGVWKREGVKWIVGGASPPTC